MTSPTNKEIAEAFRRAKRLLETHPDGDVFICHALSAQDTDAAWAACAIVAERLHPHAIYGSWLAQHHPELFHVEFREDKLTPRLQWLDALIKEFSA